MFTYYISWFCRNISKVIWFLKSVITFNKFSWPSSFICLYIWYCSYIFDLILSLHVFNMVKCCCIGPYLQDCSFMCLATVEFGFECWECFVCSIYLCLNDLEVNPMYFLLHCTLPVSYTHLDVYKRQGCVRSQ